MRVLMDINQMLLDASEDHTPEELAELTKQHSQMTVLAGQAVSFVLLTVAGCTITMEMLELYFDAGERFVLVGNDLDSEFGSLGIWVWGEGGLKIFPAHGWPRRLRLAEAVGLGYRFKRKFLL